MAETTLWYELIHPSARPPEKAYANDMGHDVFAVETYAMRPRTITYVRTGLRVETPPGWGAFVMPRSSYGSLGVQVLGGVVDTANFRGELIVMLYHVPIATGDQARVKTGIHNMFDDADFVGRPIQIDKGTAVGQLVVLPVPDVEMVEFDSLSETDRGTGGFGSTG